MDTMKIKVNIASEEYWTKETAIEIELPVVPRIGEHVFLSKKDKEELASRIEKYEGFREHFHIESGSVYYHVADCTHVVAVAYDLYYGDPEIFIILDRLPR